ncbi:taurine transport system ATP-binding protein [Enterococcus sp. AZ194]|uniref:ABC transporter ATP-binding protein n=1 Tax=Enterococcus sp. AZ194 TaxID=2774629 RepID=UPI003F288C2A
MIEKLLEVCQAEIVYQSKEEQIQAIKPIDLTINQGDFICLVGPSGCGKTTLLKMIAGYLKPTSGSCYMKGREITSPSWNRGVVFQSPTLYPWLNVEKNIEYGLKVRKVPKEERNRISDYFLKQIDMKSAAKRYPFELSGGMKQRVSMARALANEPELLLMDEPFGALDALTRINMQALLRRIWLENNKTIFLITHDIEEALSLGTKILVMSSGPGSIIESYDVHYARIALERDNRVKSDEKFVQLKSRILNRIMG